MKIAWVGRCVGAVTGPVVYAEALARAAPQHGWVRLTPEAFRAQPAGFDGVHFQDIKHVRPADWKKARSARRVIEIHDDYFLSPWLCVPDAPLRLLLALARRGRYRRIAREADAVLVHSRWMQRRIEGWLGRSVRFIPYPAPTFSPDNEIPNREPVILFVGRDWFRKGLATVIRALPEVRMARPDVRLVVIGDEYSHSDGYHRRLARGLPVEFPGGLPNTEVRAWMRRASVLAVPSRQEAFGLVLLEAAAEGLPVVAAQVGGIPEFVDSTTGWLVARADARQWASALIEAIDHPEIGRMRGAAARARLGDWPDAATVAQATFALTHG